MVEFDTSKDEFLAQHKGFSLREAVSYPNGGFSYFYDNGSDMVIIDYGICNHDDDTPVFSYMLITDKQNGYMHKFKRLFRFLGYEKQLVDRYLDTDEIVDPTEYTITISDRAEQVDVSPLELHFERNFSNVYGLNGFD